MFENLKIVYLSKGWNPRVFFNVCKSIQDYEREKRVIIGKNTIMITTYSPSNVFSSIGKQKMRRFVEVYINLLTKGIPMPEILGCIEERENGKLIRAYIFTEFLDSYIVLRDSLYVKKMWERYIPETARVLKKLHTTGFAHGDFNTANILFDKEGKAYIIDLLRAGRLRWWRKIKDFVRLELTLDQYDLFIQTYYARSRPVYSLFVFFISIVRRLYKFPLRKLKSMLSRKL